MRSDQKPRPFMEYQSRVSGYSQEAGMYRGTISCMYNDGSLAEPEYFEFLCDTLRASKQEATSDARDLFYKLETTSPPTVAFSGHIYSLPTAEEHDRAAKWLQENDHVALHFAQEFPGARLVNTAPLGASTSTGR